MGAVQKRPPGPLKPPISNIWRPGDDLSKVTASAESDQKPEVTKVQIVSGADSIIAMVKNSLTPVFGPIGELALIVVLVVLMLLERMRLRGRFLRLIGHSRLATTTLAIDEAGSRLSGFLSGQLVVSAGYAVVLGIGLFL